MPEEARNRRCKLLLKLFTVELGSPALVSLFPVLYLPSIPGGVVCKMLKQAIWKVLSKRVVSDSGDKLLLPCLYLPTTSFHAGQGPSREHK
ncbi:hypothetical protein V6Z11_D10G255500 [Gossypium hirsutum]